MQARDEGFGNHSSGKIDRIGNCQRTDPVLVSMLNSPAIDPPAVLHAYPAIKGLKQKQQHW